MELLFLISSLSFQLFKGLLLFLGFIFIISFLAYLIDKVLEFYSNKK